MLFYISVIADKYFKNVEEIKYLGTRVTNQNVIHEEINGGLNSRNDCHHSVQTSCLPKSSLKTGRLNIQNYNFLCYFVWV